MSNDMAVKSILKQPTRKKKKTAPTDAQKAQAATDKRNMDIALHHAHRIQTQKQIQLLILTNTETLAALPAGARHTPTEAAYFARLVWPFQPSDFNALVEERRSEDKCGYALCPNAPRAVTLGESAAWKLRGQGAEDYCRTECVRKAMFVKAQLSGVPAWEREPGQHAEILLSEEDRGGVVAPARVGKVVDEGGRELAMERGEPPASFRPKQVMMEMVVEKRASKPALPPSQPMRVSSAAIEGYEPRVSFKGESDDEDEDGYGESNSEHEEEDSRVMESVQRDLAGEKARKGEEAEAERERQEEEMAWRDLDRGLREIRVGD